MTNKQKRAIGYAVRAEERKVQEKIIQLNGWWDDFKKSKYKTMNNYLNYRQKWNNPEWYRGDLKKVIKKATSTTYSVDFENYASEIIKNKRCYKVVSDCLTKEDYENDRWCAELDDYTCTGEYIQEYTPGLACRRYLECIADACQLCGADGWDIDGDELFIRAVTGVVCVYCRVQVTEITE